MNRRWRQIRPLLIAATVGIVAGITAVLALVASTDANWDTEAAVLYALAAVWIPQTLLMAVLFTRMKPPRRRSPDRARTVDRPSRLAFIKQHTIGEHPAGDDAGDGSVDKAGIGQTDQPPSTTRPPPSTVVEPHTTYATV